jgi:hypothetical protein
MTNQNVESTPNLTRKGNRRNAGADTPSGPNTERSAIPAERENAGKNPNDIMPGAHPETVREIAKERGK